MSSVINLNQAALYGFINEWGDDAFFGSIRVGNWGSGAGDTGRFAQNYNYQTTTTNTWGTKIQHDHSGTAYPYSYLNSSSAAIDGGTAQGGLSVSYAQWTSATEENYSAYLNLYTLLSPQSSTPNVSSTLSVFEPYDYDVIGAAGGSYTGNNRSYTSYVQPTFTVTNGVNSSEVVYQTVNDGALDISEGQITTSNQQLANGKGLNATFIFQPGSNSPISISASFTQSIHSSNTTGTSQSQATSGSNSATFGITGTETASVGEDQANYYSESLQASYQDSWETAWSNTSTADFSSTNAISSSSGFSLTTTENLNGAIPTGYSTTANGNQTPLYQYTTKYTNPLTGQQTTSTFDLYAGAEYEWTLQYYAGTVQNVVSGEYSLSGSAGTITDSTNNSVGGNIGQAFYYANQGNAWDALGYDYNPIVSFNSSNPSDITSVTINGSTVSSTSECVNLYLGLSYVGPSASAASAKVSSSSALMLQPPGSQEAARAQTKWLKMEDNLIVLPQNTRTSNSYHGDDSDVFLKDTLGQDLITLAGGRDHVLLRGNSVQPNNPGDIVYLGSGKDVADARKAVGTNTIHANSGADKVLDGPSNLMVDLGSGKDSYVFGGGYDMVILGGGHDQLDLESESGGVTVGDFSVGQDVITGLDKKTRLVWDPSLVAFTIEKNDRITGRLFAASTTLGPEFWYGLAVQNVPELRLDDPDWKGTTWQDIRARYGRFGYATELQTQDWSCFSESPGNINDAAEFIARSAGVSSLSKKDLVQVNRLAGAADGFTDFIAATTGYVTSL